VVSVLDGTVEADGYRWQKVGAGTLTGWAADIYLEPSTLAPAAGVTPVGAGLPRASSATNVLSPAALDQALAASPWPKDLWPTVKRIIQCESGGNTAAVGPLGHRGLMQVDPKLHGPVPSDAVGQLTQAYNVYLKQGWNAWVCY
jgi:soluble lytic murein transglycosylase-like protein